MSAEKLDQNIKLEIEQVKKKDPQLFRQLELSPKNEVKLEEGLQRYIGNDEMIYEQPKEQAQEGTEVRQSLLKAAVRASYKQSSNPPPVWIECRILQSVSEQKSLRLSTKKYDPSQTETQAKDVLATKQKILPRIMGKLQQLLSRTIVKSSGKFVRNAPLPINESVKIYQNSKVLSPQSLDSEKYGPSTVTPIASGEVALSYIFNSKIDNYKSHIKYRTKFLESLQDPHNFDHLKDY